MNIAVRMKNLSEDAETGLRLFGSSSLDKTKEELIKVLRNTPTFESGTPHYHREGKAVERTNTALKILRNRRLIEGGRGNSEIYLSRDGLLLLNAIHARETENHDYSYDFCSPHRL